MGHNSVVSGHPKSTGIPRVNWLSMEPLGFGASQCEHQMSITSIWIDSKLKYLFIESKNA